MNIKKTFKNVFMKKEAITVLIVDDDRSTREIYRDILDLAGFSVLESSSAEDAITQFHSRTPEVVFTGIDLPGFDGFSLMTRIRESASRQPIFIVNSHHDRERDRERAVAFGVDGFFVRGFSSPKNVIDFISSATIGRESRFFRRSDPVFWDRNWWESVTERHGMKIFLASSTVIVAFFSTALFLLFL